MSFRYYNAHPLKRAVYDCTKRSISLTTGIPYRELEKGMSEHKKITGVRFFYNTPNPQSYMENVLGFPKRSLYKKSDDSHITVEEFAKAHPDGRYIVSISGHWTACIDGIVYDTWDCCKEEVLSYYEITQFERTKIEKKFCFTVKNEQDNFVFITVYDGLGTFATKQIRREEAQKYIDNLHNQGLFNYDEMGEYI